MLQVSNTSVLRSSIFCNTRIKSYPSGASSVLCCSDPIFGGKGWEECGKEKAVKATRKPSEEADTSDRAMRRARAQVRDIALCTPFRYFVTLTLDGSKVDRYDVAAVTRKLNQWLDNQVRRHGLAYVLVPERHKDGAIHFHGFFNGALQAVDSGVVSLGKGKPKKPRSEAQKALWLEQGGHTVFNLPGWTLGFTTAIELYGEYEKAVGYVCKYIGKDGTKVGGRWYYSGGALGHPIIDYCNTNIWELKEAKGAYSFAVEDAGLCFVQVNIPGCSTVVSRPLAGAAAMPGGASQLAGGLLPWQSSGHAVVHASGHGLSVLQ